MWSSWSLLIFLPSHHGWSRPRRPLLLTSFDSCHSTRHWQAVKCCNCDELCFVFALQMSIIAQICSSSFNIVRALLFLYLSKCMSRLLPSTSYSRRDSFDAVPVHHPWHWVVRVIHSLSVWQTPNHISLLRAQFKGVSRYQHFIDVAKSLP